MPTNEQTNAAYQEALAALQRIVTDGNATAEEKQRAKEKRDTLILDFVGKAIANVKARTQKFQAFIDEMNALIDEFDPATTIEGILQLKTVVDEAAGLIAAATGAGGPAMAASPAAPARAPKRATKARRPKKAPAGSARKPARGKSKRRQPTHSRTVAKRSAKAKRKKTGSA